MSQGIYFALPSCSLAKGAAMVRSMMRSISSIALLFVASCGASATKIPINTADTCTIMISGGLTASAMQTCVPGAVAPNTEPNTIDFGVSAKGDFGTLAFTAIFPGSALMTGTYEPASVSKAEIDLGSSGAEWSESGDGSGSDAGALDAGTFTLVLTSAGTSYSATDGTNWSGSHGTLDATLTPQAGTTAAGNVTIHVGF